MNGGAGMFHGKHYATDNLASSHPARAVDFVMAVMDRAAHRRRVLTQLVDAVADCGDHLTALARHTAARCSENPAEASALLRRAERRLKKGLDALETGEDDTLAEMTRDGVTITALRYAHTAFSVAATELESN